MNFQENKHRETIWFFALPEAGGFIPQIIRHIQLPFFVSNNCDPRNDSKLVLTSSPGENFFLKIKPIRMKQDKQLQFVIPFLL